MIGLHKKGERGKPTFKIRGSKWLNGISVCEAPHNNKIVGSPPTTSSIVLWRQQMGVAGADENPALP